MRPPAADAAPPRLIYRVRRVAGAPIVAARAWLRGGARLERIPGQAVVCGRLLAEGSRRRDYRRIARQAEDRGMAVESFGSYESIGASIDALAGDWQLALDWLAELVLEPAFPAGRFTWMRRQVAAELDSLLDQGDLRTAYGFAEQLYHPHPYGRPLHGTADDLARLTAEDCPAFHARALAHGLVVVVTGEIDEEAVGRRIEALFADLEPAQRAVPLPAVPAPAGRSPARRRVDLPAGDQAHFYAGHLTIPRNHPDRPALDLLAVALGAGGGLGGRLSTLIREQQGLAYSVDVATAAGAGLDPGRLVVYAATDAEHLERLEALVGDELRRLVEDGLSEAEIEEARSYLLGSHPFRRETARQWADRLADAVFYDLPDAGGRWCLERWQRLDRRAVDDAARLWIKPGELRLTTGLPAGTPGAPPSRREAPG